MLCTNAEGASLRGCNFEDPAGIKANLEGEVASYTWATDKPEPDLSSYWTLMYVRLCWQEPTWKVWTWREVRWLGLTWGSLHWKTPNLRTAIWEELRWLGRTWRWEHTHTCKFYIHNLQESVNMTGGYQEICCFLFILVFNDLTVFKFLYKVLGLKRYKHLILWQ